jgi:trigger factor
MIPGFVEGIVGMEQGATKDVNCSFPESYPQEEAAGRQATFTISLVDLKTRELPDLDDAFAQQASDKGTLAELRTDLEARLKEDAERRHQANRREALLEALVEQLEVELPETLIQQEMRNLVEQTASQIAQQGMDVKKVFTPDVVRSLMDTSRPEAEKRLRRSLALRALARTEKIEVPDADVATRASEVRRELSGRSPIDEERLRQAVSEELLEEQLLSWLEANATISERLEPAKAPAEVANAAEKPKKAKKGASSAGDSELPPEAATTKAKTS